MDQTIRRSTVGLFNAANPISTLLFRAQTAFYITHLICSIRNWEQAFLFYSGPPQLFTHPHNNQLAGRQPAACETKPESSANQIAPTCWLKSGCVSVIWCIPTFPFQTCIPILTHRCIPLSGHQLWHRILPALIISPLSSHLRNSKSDMLQKSHEISQQHFSNKCLLWCDLLLHMLVLSFLNWNWPRGNFSACGACRDPFHMLQVSDVDLRLALSGLWVHFPWWSASIQSMFKIGQFRSVDPGPSEI